MGSGAIIPTRDQGSYFTIPYSPYSCRFQSSCSDISFATQQGKTLEELDAVFNVPLRSLNSYGIKQFFYFWGHYVLRRDIEPPKVPSARDTVEYTERQFTKEKQHEPSARV